MSEDPPPASWRVSGRHRRHARRLRTDQTEAEQRLWSALRAHRLLELSFRRQHPIGRIIADFACVPLKIVVELDGGQHYSERGQVRDVRRDAALSEMGFLVLRFSNLDVLQNLEGVLDVIAATAKSRGAT